MDQLHPAFVTATSSRRETVWLVGGLWSLGFLVMAVSAIAYSPEPAVTDLIRAALMAGVGAAMCFILWRTIIAAQAPLAARLLLLMVGVIAAVALHTAIDIGTAALIRSLLSQEAPIARVVSDNPLRAFLMQLTLISNLVLYAALYALFGMAAIGLRSAIETRERERLLSEARAATAQAQLAALRYQLNPHFVFNTLNAIGSLVYTGRSSEAGAMIDKLSDFLRASLGSDAGAFTTLDDELATLQAYLDIEAVRFGDRLCVSYDCPPELASALVPSFLLQPLVENAIKHAVAPAMRPVTIRLAARREGGDLAVLVEDDGAGAGDDAIVRPRGAGVGLRNVRERLAIHYGAAGRLDAARRSEGFSAGVRLPLTFAAEAVAA